MHEPIGVLFDERLVNRALRMMYNRRDYYETQGDYARASSYNSAAIILHHAMLGNTEILDKLEGK